MDKKELKKRLLFLDDYRDPFDTEMDWMVFSPIGRDCDIRWVKDYYEFVEWITENGLPSGVCFDHDLGDVNDKNFHKEKSGFDCAKWLVDYCIDNELELPLYKIQSANPVGRDNIDGLLKSFIKFKEKE